MKLAFSSNAYLRFSFNDAAKKIGKLGYQGIEIMADAVSYTHLRAHET
jgi:hypothetical protein